MPWRLKGGPEAPSKNRVYPSYALTSANFTEAAHERNIEAGFLVDDPALAGGLEAQFDGLVAAGMLERVPGL